MHIPAYWLGPTFFSVIWCCISVGAQPLVSNKEEGKNSGTKMAGTNKVATLSAIHQAKTRTVEMAGDHVELSEGLLHGSD